MRAYAGMVLFLAALLVLSGCNAGPKVSASTPEVVKGVRVVTVQEVALPDIFRAAGTVRSWRTSPIAAQVMGNVVSINVREGDSVKRGQVLAVLDDSQYRASRARSSAALQAAEHEIASAQSDYDLAKSNLNRLEYLHKKEIISDREYDDARARNDSTAARLELARANREQAAAALNQETVLLGYTSIRAPFDGIVTDRRLDPGALATPGTQLLTIEESGRYRLEATVDERDLKYVHQGQTIPVELEALGGEPLLARVVQIVPAADPASRSFLVKLDLPERSGLRSGLFGRAAFTRGSRQSTAAPRSAVIEHGQLQGVYVLDKEHIATLRYVTLGNAVDGTVEVLSGLSAGDTIVADPAGRELAGKRLEVQ